MKRRKFLGRSMAAGMALGGTASLWPSGAAPGAQAPRSDLPAKFTPTAYAVRRSAYSPFTTPDYYTYADDLAIEWTRPGKPYQGKVLAAIQPHSDDVPLYCGGTVAKLIDEGYTGYLIRFSNDEASGRTLGAGVVQNEIDNHEVGKALGCKKAYTFYYRNHRMDDDSEIEIRARLIFLFRLLQVNTILTMDPYDHYDENPDHLVTGRVVEAACWMAGGSKEYPEHFKAGLKPTSVREKYYHACSPQGHNLINRVVDISSYIDPKVRANIANKKEDVMLAEFFESPFRIQELRDGPDGRLLEGFAQELCQAGYAEITARRHIRAAEHLIYWTGRKGRTVVALDERMIEEFVQHLNRCRCPRYGRTHRRDLRKGARLFLGYTRFASIVTTRIVEEIIVDPALLVSFCGWMRQQRGTCEATLYNYNLHLRDLLKSLGEDPGRFDAHKLRQFILDTSQRCGWAAAKKCTTAVRMFLRFLIADGKCAAGLDASIPVLAHWRLSSLPPYLQSDEVERVIASCDPATPVGKRDRAILLLLARLVLRAGDIVQLRLGDLDWKEAGICVSGKGRRQTLLPLTQEIGDAIASYIKDGRPQTAADTLFIRSRAPFRALANHCAISMIVAQAMRRAGVVCPSRGAAHVLRHSVASSMLRHGASLQEIAGVLRHRSIATTEIYAKVDVVVLRQIAQPWPEAKSC